MWELFTKKLQKSLLHENFKVTESRISEPSCNSHRNAHTSRFNWPPENLKSNPEWSWFRTGGKDLGATEGVNLTEPDLVPMMNSMHCKTVFKLLVGCVGKLSKVWCCSAVLSSVCCHCWLQASYLYLCSCRILTVEWYFCFGLSSQCSGIHACI